MFYSMILARKMGFLFRSSPFFYPLPICLCFSFSHKPPPLMPNRHTIHSHLSMKNSTCSLSSELPYHFGSITSRPLTIYDPCSSFLTPVLRFFPALCRPHSDASTTVMLQKIARHNKNDCVSHLPAHLLLTTTSDVTAMSNGSG